MFQGLFDVFHPDVSVPILALVDSRFELVNRFVQLRVLHHLLRFLRVPQRAVSVFDQQIRMALFAVLHRFIGVLNRLTHVLRGVSQRG
jgi:hypothetical protein